jgi:hypothetical protein
MYIYFEQDEWQIRKKRFWTPQMQKKKKSRKIHSFKKFISKHTAILHPLHRFAAYSSGPGFVLYAQVLYHSSHTANSDLYSCAFTLYNNNFIKLS